MRATLPLLISALVAAANAVAVSAFPGLFSRPSLFQRAQQEEQHRFQHQALPAGRLQQQQQLALAANPLAPAFGPFGLRQPAGLQAPMPSVHFGAPPADQLGQAASLQQAALVHSMASYHEPALVAPAQTEGLALSGMTVGSAQPLALERGAGSQSELVDKIERHIERQVEQSLDEQAEQRAAAASGYRRPLEQRAERQSEAAASGHVESEETAGEGPDKRQEEPAEEGGAAKARGAEEKEPEEEEGGQLQQHEQPPEAFEVHHKKGGKSFQYFHQGHQH